MSDIKNFTTGSHNVVDFVRTGIFNFRFWKSNPTYFYPAGIWVFCGPQGSGKTLSAVQTVQSMKKQYPRARVVSNLDVKGIDYDAFTDYSQLQDSNGTEGIIFLLDEIHVLWNSLESKDIPISEMATFCQMRKDRRVIIGTSQVYSRIAKPIREQLQYVIDCHTYFRWIQVNTLIDPASAIEKDGHISGERVGLQWWFHRPELYQSYDTLTKIERANRVAVTPKEVRRRG